MLARVGVGDPDGAIHLGHAGCILQFFVQLQGLEVALQGLGVIGTGIEQHTDVAGVGGLGTKRLPPERRIRSRVGQQLLQFGVGGIVQHLRTVVGTGQVARPPLLPQRVRQDQPLSSASRKEHRTLQVMVGGIGIVALVSGAQIQTGLCFTGGATRRGHDLMQRVEPRVLGNSRSFPCAQGQYQHPGPLPSSNLPRLHSRKFGETPSRAQVPGVRTSFPPLWLNAH